MSEHSFGARQFKLVDIALHGHLQGTCQGFEDAFNLVVLVLALGLDVEVHAGSIRQTLEEMEEHLRWHFADALTPELGIPYEPRTAAEVEGHLAESIVHRQTIAVALNAALVA